MMSSIYQSLENICFFENRLLDNCIPISKCLNADIKVYSAEKGFIKSGSYKQCQFTACGTYKNHFALFLCYPSTEPFIFNSNSLKNPSAILTPPGWKYFCYFPKDFKVFLILWESPFYDFSFSEILNTSSVIWSISENDPLEEKLKLLDKNFNQTDKLLDSLSSEIKNIPKKYKIREWATESNLALKAFDYMQNKLSKGINIAEICENFKVSRRNLETSYKKSFGISPGKHLKHLKLFQIRKMLISSDSESKITEILKEQGITHTSHFGQFYKGYFKEQMVETLKKRFQNKMSCSCHSCNEDDDIISKID